MKSTHWGDAVAAEVLNRDNRTHQHQSAIKARAARLRELVTSEGVLWFARVEAELRAAAAAFNTRMGRPVVTVVQSPTGRLIMTAADRDAGYVTVQPVLTTGVGQLAPGAYVTIDQGGCVNRVPYDFDVVDDHLCMRGQGDVRGPEAFAQAAAASWMSTLALGGR